MYLKFTRIFAFCLFLLFHQHSKSLYFMFVRWYHEQFFLILSDFNKFISPRAQVFLIQKYIALSL